MSKIEDGGPAFPTSIEWGPEGGVGFHGDEAGKPNSTTYYSGMTLRDYFAAKAMQGMWASDTEAWHCGGTQGALASRAIDAYAMADAMLAAREGK